MTITGPSSTTPTGGRPTLLTPELGARLISYIQDGHSQRVAAQAAHVSARTLTRWLQQGEQAQDKLDDGGTLTVAEDNYRQFWLDLRAAENQVEFEALDALRANFVANPAMAAWYLERKRPAEWGRRSEVTVGPNDRMAQILATAVVSGTEQDEPETSVHQVPPAIPPPPQ